jgi:hypothetical protein
MGDGPDSPASRANDSDIPRDDRVTDDEIRARAYELYLERHGENGNDVDDWLRAEREFSLRRPSR